METLLSWLATTQARALKWTIHQTTNRGIKYDCTTLSRYLTDCTNLLYWIYRHDNDNHKHS